MSVFFYSNPCPFILPCTPGRLTFARLRGAPFFGFNSALGPPSSSRFALVPMSVFFCQFPCPCVLPRSPRPYNVTHLRGAPALWFSCLRGLLPDPDLDALRCAYPAFFWPPLVEVLGDFAMWVSTVETDPVTADELAGAYVWRQGGPSLREALVRDPLALRKILNGGRFWPPCVGSTKTLSLFWLCAGCPGLSPAPTLVCPGVGGP